MSAPSCACGRDGDPTVLACSACEGCTHHAWAMEDWRDQRNDLPPAGDPWHDADGPIRATLHERRHTCSAGDRTMTATTTTVRYYHELEQRSDEWFQARCGIITASVIGRLLSVRKWQGADYECPECGAAAGDPCRSKTRKGGAEFPAPIKTLHAGRTALAASLRDSSPLIITPAVSEEANNVTMGLIAERITGHVDETRMTDDMWRGVIEEPYARDAYTKHHAPAVECGFVTRDLHGSRVGYSPDGLVGDDGLIEIKSRNNKRQLQIVLAGGVPQEHMPQLQCGLFVTGRKWVDYVSFSGGMPLIVKRIEPSPKWFAAIDSAVALFEETAARTIPAYNNAVAGLPVMERVDPDADVELKLA